MGLIIGLFIVALFGGATLLILVSIGFFGNAPTYNKDLRERLVKNIYAQEMLRRQNQADLDSIPSNILTRFIPMTSTYYHVKKDLEKLGITDF